MYTFDAHQDIADAMLYASHGNFWKKNKLHEGWNDLNLPVNNQSDFIRLKKGNVKSVFGVSCAFAVDPKGNIVPCPNHLHETLRQLNLYHQLHREGKQKINFIKTKGDLSKIRSYDLSFLLAIEGADSIDEDLVNLETFFNLGVRSIGLTWSFNNALAGGCNEDGNLTKLGKKAISRMAQLGIILDLSHLNEKSSISAVKASTKPMIISHTASSSVYNHPRNASDKVMKMVAESGGAVGICAVPKFINENPTIDDVVRHFSHTIELVGIKNVIVGTDFGSMTGEKLIPNFAEVSDMPNIIKLFKKDLKLTNNEIELVTHQNLENILYKILPKS